MRFVVSSEAGRLTVELPDGLLDRMPVDPAVDAAWRDLPQIVRASLARA